jgi:hypothetical protein
MDSGVVRTEFYRNQFDPSAPLLPEEVCWIMDRMFAAEVSHPPVQFRSTEAFATSRCYGIQVARYLRASTPVYTYMSSVQEEYGMGAKLPVLYSPMILIILCRSSISSYVLQYTDSSRHVTSHGGNSPRAMF